MATVPFTQTEYDQIYNNETNLNTTTSIQQGNTTNIATNAADIATNAADIAAIAGFNGPIPSIGQIQTNTDGLAAEIVARQLADTNIFDAYTSGISAIDNDLQDEETARIQADADEAKERFQADADETTARIQADTIETAARIQGDIDEANARTAEINISNSAEALLR